MNNKKKEKLEKFSSESKQMKDWKKCKIKV